MSVSSILEDVGAANERSKLHDSFTGGSFTGGSSGTAVDRQGRSSRSDCSSSLILFLVSSNSSCRRAIKIASSSSRSEIVGVGKASVDAAVVVAIVPTRVNKRSKVSILLTPECSVRNQFVVNAVVVPAAVRAGDFGAALGFLGAAAVEELGGA